MHYRDADGSEVQGFVPEEGTKSAVNLTAASLLKVGAGRVFRASVIVAGSAVGTVNDCATTGAAAAANQIGTLPNTVGTYLFNWPVSLGLVVVPGTGQTVALSYA